MSDLDTQAVEDERTARILDAVGEVVLERGINGVTTALVARRARVAPGKFYELFADKYAVIEAAAERNGRRYFEALQEAIADRTLDMSTLARISVDLWIDFCRRDPSFRVLRFATIEGSVQDPDEDRIGTSIRGWMEFLAREYDVTLPDDLHRRLTLTAKFVIDPVDYAFQLDPVNGDAEVIGQVQRVLDFLMTEQAS